MKLKVAVAALAVASMALVGCSSGDDADAEATAAATTSAEATDAMEESGSGTIVDVATDAGDFTTLVAAVDAAGLVDTLNGEGPYTVFAPTDEAFEALPEGLVDKLLEPENKEVLTSILTYHVVAGEVMSSDIEPGKVETVEGEKVDIQTADGDVMVNDATVTSADVEASNGVIHVIDTVLVPPSVDVSSL